MSIGCAENAFECFRFQGVVRRNSNAIPTGNERFQLYMFYMTSELALPEIPQCLHRHLIESPAARVRGNLTQLQGFAVPIQ